MRTYSIDEFYDERGHLLTAPSRPIHRKRDYPANAHVHGSYAHCHAGAHAPHKHVIADADLRAPAELAQEAAEAVAPRAGRRLAKSA